MKSPKIFISVSGGQSILFDFLHNIGSLVLEKSMANVLILDDKNNIEAGFINFVISDTPGEGYFNIALKSSPQETYQRILQTFTVVDKFYTGRRCEEYCSGDGEKKIVAGFARHFSHNVLNALLMASGFIRMIKANSESNDHINSLWKSTDQKLFFIEELVNGYSDYYQVINLKPTDIVDITGSLKDILNNLANKTFDKSFSAHLRHYNEFYEMSCIIADMPGRNIMANPLFLKLALCYILKDTIRYFQSSIETVSFSVEAYEEQGRYVIDIFVKNVNIPGDIIKSMFKPWDHNIFLQSFDYWGIVIAQTVFERHGGFLYVENSGLDLKYSIKL